MNPQDDMLKVQRVDNGWVITTTTVYASREGYALPGGTFVAVTPEQLASLLRAWAQAQESK